MVVLYARAHHARRATNMRKRVAGSAADVDSTVVQYQSRVCINKQKEKWLRLSSSGSRIRVRASTSRWHIQRNSATLFFDSPAACKDSIVTHIKVISSMAVRQASRTSSRETSSTRRPLPTAPSATFQCALPQKTHGPQSPVRCLRRGDTPRSDQGPYYVLFVEE